MTLVEILKDLYDDMPRAKLSLASLHGDDKDKGRVAAVLFLCERLIERVTEMQSTDSRSM